MAFFIALALIFKEIANMKGTDIDDSSCDYLSQVVYCLFCAHDLYR